VSSKKSKSNGRKNNKQKRNSDNGEKHISSISSARPETFEQDQLERLWKDIFQSPEFEQDIKVNGLIDTQTSREKKEPVVSELLTGTFSNKLKIIREAIQEIEEDIDARVELGLSLRLRIDSEIEKCKAMLTPIENHTLGYNPSIEFRRLSIERQVFLLTKELRAEDLRVWEDIVALFKERRNLEMEYKALINTSKMLGKDQNN
jgi:hypothetical protein